MSGRRAIVVGAGVGGLTAAMRLAHQGWQVDVYEKTDSPGGRCGRIVGEGYTFDLGPTILLMPFVFEQAFAAVGKNVHDYLDLRRCDPNYRITFADDSVLTMSPNLQVLKSELERLEPGSFARFERFFARGKDQHDTALSEFVGKHFGGLSEFLTLANIPKMLRIGAHQKLFGQVSKVFKDERLRQAMSFQTMYLGLSPYEAPAVFSLLPYTELAVGVWYPMGGMGSVGRALEKACGELGVNIHFSTPVCEIVTESQRAVGVRLGDQRVVNADIVLCNADLPWAYKHLLPQAPRPELERKRYTASGLMYYFGVRRRVDGLEHHNVFFGNDFKGSFADIFHNHKIPDSPSFYVNAPTRTDASMAPPEHDALYVLVPVPHQHPSLDWKVQKGVVREKVLARLRSLGVDFSSDIVYERVITPDDWQTSLNLERGSNFGLAQSMFQIGPFRPKVYDERIENLFFCGASAQPGTGVPTVMISAQLACEAIAKRAVLPSSIRKPAPNLEAA